MTSKQSTQKTQEIIAKSRDITDTSILDKSEHICERLTSDPQPWEQSRWVIGCLFSRGTLALL